MRDINNQNDFKLIFKCANFGGVSLPKKNYEYINSNEKNILLYLFQNYDNDFCKILIEDIIYQYNFENGFYTIGIILKTVKLYTNTTAFLNFEIKNYSSENCYK